MILLPLAAALAFLTRTEVAPPVATAAAVRQVPFQTSEEAHQAWVSAQSEINARHDCLTDCEKENDNNNREWGKANQKVYDARAERDLGLKELREGLYCSQCNRPKSQIERELRVSFETHLQNVKGTAISAPPDVMARKEKEFNDKVRDAEREVAQYHQNYQRLSDRWDKCNNERVQACNAYNNAEYWEGVLKAREEAEKRRKAAQELADKMRKEAEARRQQRLLQLKILFEKQKEILAQLQAQLKLLQESMFGNLAPGGGYGSADDYTSAPPSPPTNEDNSQINSGFLGGNYNQTGDADLNLPGDGQANSGNRALDWINKNVGSPSDIAKEFWRHKDIDPNNPKTWFEGDIERAKEEAYNKFKEALDKEAEDRALKLFAGDQDNDETREELKKVGLWETIKDNWKYITANPIKAVKARFEMIRNNLRRARHYSDEQLDKLMKQFEKFYGVKEDGSPYVDED